MKLLHVPRGARDARDGISYTPGYGFAPQSDSVAHPVVQRVARNVIPAYWSLFSPLRPRASRAQYGRVPWPRRDVRARYPRGLR
jgi:hypothetical protein